jgi:putative phage-type endonuclease
MKVVARTDELTRDEWLEARSKGIGGSDAGTIMGQNPYKSAWTLWAEKTGRITDTFKGNEATRLGQAFERPIAEQYAQMIAEDGLVVVAWPVLLQGKKEWQLANVDFFICEYGNPHPDDNSYELGKVSDWRHSSPPPNRVGILEVKTTGLAGRGNADQWGEYSVPAAYRMQGCHYASVTGIKDVTFACLIGGQGIVTRDVRYTQSEIDELTTIEEFFWWQVNFDEEPIADGGDLDALKKLYPKSTDETVEVGEFLADIVAEYRVTKAALEETEALLKKLRAQMEQAIGSAQAVEWNGKLLYTFKSTKDSEVLDVKALQAEHPDIAAKFMKPKPGYRVLKVASDD